MTGKLNTESMLSPYRVLDLADEKGLLCGKILGDLGADVDNIGQLGVVGGIAGNAFIINWNPDLLGGRSGLKTGVDLFLFTVYYIDSDPIRIKQAKNLIFQVNKDLIDVFGRMDLVPNVI